MKKHLQRRAAFWIICALLTIGFSGYGTHAEQSAAVASEPLPAAPDQATTGIDFGAVRALLEEVVDDGTVRGSSLLLVQDDKVLLKEAYGNLSVDDRVRIASSTKPVATVGILMLVDDNKLSLDDTIGSTLPEFRGTKVENATLRQLLSHTAGILGQYPGGRPSRGSLADFSKLIAKSGTLQPPGSFNYSGVSIDIACRMAEVAAGVPFEEHIQSRVWQPLGMSHSAFNMAADPGSVSSAERAKGHGRYVSCGGGMESTLDDMALFYEMLLQGGTFGGVRFLSQESYHEMTRKQGVNPRKQDDPYTSGEYGLGLYRDRVAADGSPLTISHGGALGTMPWADLDTGLIGVFFTQSTLRNVKPVIAKIQHEVRPGSEAPDIPATAQTRQPTRGQGQRGQGQRGQRQRDPQQMFKSISGGADVIDLKQFRDFIEKHGRSSRLKGQPSRIEGLFDRLDANGDGLLTAEEYGEIGNLRR